MTFFDKNKIKSEGCICHILVDPEIFINDTIFHNNICCLHYKYLKSNPDNNDNENKQYQQTGRNYFIEVVEYNIFKHKIRDATICYLAEYTNMFFFSK